MFEHAQMCKNRVLSKRQIAHTIILYTIFTIGIQGILKMFTELFEQLKPEFEKWVMFMSRPDWIELAKQQNAPVKSKNC